MMKLSLKQPVRVCKFFKVSAVFILVFSSLFVYNSWSNYDELVLEKDSLKRVIQNRNKVYPSVSNYEKKDWHDWAFIEYEKSRVGPGEQGAAYELTDSKDIELDDKLFEIEGLSVVVSDKISVNRSIPDYRHPKYSILNSFNLSKSYQSCLQVFRDPILKEASFNFSHRNFPQRISVNSKTNNSFNLQSNAT